MSLRYGIIGTGAIGGYYGGKLAHNGKEVHFLFHKDYEYVKSNGLQIDSINGDFHLDPINAYKSTTDMPVCDVVLVCLKSTNNALLKQMLPPLLHEKTLVILIQNGIGLEEDVQDMFPSLSLAAGLAFICSGKFKPGCITHQSQGKISIAPYSCHDNDLLHEIIADFKELGVETALAEYMEARWRKAVWNIPFNGMTVALNATTDQLLAHPSTEKLIYELMLEVIQAANHIGLAHPIEKEFADKMIAVTKKMPPYSPSMKLDFDYRRPLEIGYIYSRPVMEAMKHEFDMPKVSMLEKELRYIQSTYLSE
jgi:2-dehydropantoate 2-reductase